MNYAAAPAAEKAAHIRHAILPLYTIHAQKTKTVFFRSCDSHTADHFGNAEESRRRTSPPTVLVRARLCISMQAYCLEWHLRDALTPLLFDDALRREANQVRDPVAPAKPSLAARRKKAERFAAGNRNCAQTKSHRAFALVPPIELRSR